MPSHTKQRAKIRCLGGTGHGLESAWDDMTTLTDWRREHGHFDGNRAAQGNPGSPGAPGLPGAEGSPGEVLIQVDPSP